MQTSLFVILRDSLYVRYVQITPGDLTRNQDEVQAMYNVKDPIEIMFDQMDIGQEFEIAGNLPFSGRHLVDMGVTKIFATQ